MNKTKEKLWTLFLFLCMILLAGCEQKKSEEYVLEELVSEEDELPLVEKPIEEETENIYVHICGCVNVPGVYEMDAGSRVFEAIQRAGGLTDRAAETAVNQAESLEDGQKVYIPSKEELFAEEMQEQEINDGKININIAGKEELMTLTGIGEKRAEAILAHREGNGPFQSVEELMQVEGIKQGTYDKIKDQIKVS